MKNTVLVLLTLSVSALAGDWPHFRGPHGDGTVQAKGLLKGPSFGFEIDWQRDLGSGYSGICIVGDTGVTMYTDGKSDILIAFDTRSGAQKWSYEMGPIYTGHSGSQDGPSGTPTIDGDSVYALDPHGQLVAVTLAEGKKRWAYHMGEDLPAFRPHYGFNTVPLVVDDTVIVITGDKSDRTFTGLNKNTGAQLWHSGNDASSYTSPMIWENEGTRRLLAFSDHYLMEIDPHSGKVLWQQEHGSEDNEHYAVPVFFEKDKLLMVSRVNTGAYQLKQSGDIMEMKQLWMNKVFERSYAVPVFHEGYMYGFRSRFLTCMDPRTGEIKWRSRPPGGQGLLLLDGHLIIVSKDGALVAVEATPEGYREKSKMQLFRGASYTRPTFAGGYLYLRDLKQMARVKITEQSSTVAESEAGLELKGAFGEWVAQVQKADNKKAMIDAYMKEQTNFPITEGENLVHYIYMGEQDDVALTRGFQEEKPLTRIKGTNFFFLSEELDPDSYWEYNFSVFGDRIPDPLNPLVIGKEGNLRHELRMPLWPVPKHIDPPTGARGRLDTFSFESKHGKRDLRVYLPHGYGQSKQRYPLMLVNQGSDALEVAKMDVSLDNLIGTSIAPVIIAFVPTNRAEVTSDMDAYVDLLTDELVPLLDKKYRTNPDPRTRGIMGYARGAVVATYTAFKKPGFFGKLGTMSFVFLADREDTIKRIRDMDPNLLQVHVETSSNDYKFPGFNARTSGAELIAILKEEGYRVKEHRNGGAASWGNWRAQNSNLLEWFAPKE